MKKTLLVSGIALALSSNVFAVSDARSVGMGGVSVATADYLSAPVHNLALAAKYKEIDELVSHHLIPYILMCLVAMVGIVNTVQLLI